MNHDLEDVFVWPDGGWCYRYELPEMGSRSDDVSVLWAGGQLWIDFLKHEGEL